MALQESFDRLDRLEQRINSPEFREAARKFYEQIGPEKARELNDTLKQFTEELKNMRVKG
jgi:hypothetical protein